LARKHHAHGHRENRTRYFYFIHELVVLLQAPVPPDASRLSLYRWTVTIIPLAIPAPCVQSYGPHFALDSKYFKTD